MRIHLAVLRIIVFMVLARTCSFAEAQKIVKRVVIYSYAGGLGGGSNTLITIQRRGSKYLLNGQPVSTVQVQSLVAALSAPPLPKPDMTNLGITQEWLASKVASQRIPDRIRRAEETDSQEKLFDLNLIANVLPGLFVDDITDILLFCKVEIVFNDGTKLSAESYSYYPFMLPWSMIGERFTYNADISRAVAALLPAESVNKVNSRGMNWLTISASW